MYGPWGVEAWGSTGTAAVGAWYPAPTPPASTFTPMGERAYRPTIYGLWVIPISSTVPSLIRRSSSTGTAAVGAWHPALTPPVYLTWDFTRLRRDRAAVDRACGGGNWWRTG